ncbi:hypothetical protein ABZP36_013859 [Zizania latifolia]
MPWHGCSIIAMEYGWLQVGLFIPSSLKKGRVASKHLASLHIVIVCVWRQGNQARQGTLGCLLAVRGKERPRKRRRRLGGAADGSASFLSESARPTLSCSHRISIAALRRGRSSLPFLHYSIRTCCFPAYYCPPSIDLLFVSLSALPAPSSSSSLLLEVHEGGQNFERLRR